MYGEMQMVGVNFTALQATHYFAAKISNGMNLRLCVEALLNVLAYRMTKGESEDNVLQAVHQALSKVPEKLSNSVINVVREIEDVATGRLTSRLAIMYYVERQDLIEISWDTFVDALMCHFTEGAAEEDCEYHTMSLLVACAEYNKEIKTVLEMRARAEKVNPGAVLRFERAMQTVWVQLLQDKDAQFQEFCKRAVQGCDELRVFNPATYAEVQAELRERVRTFKLPEFAGKLVEAFSDDAHKSDK